MSQPFLFYSERCPNSKQVIETLKALNKISLYKLIAVESIPRAQIPAFLTAVPTLYNPETKDVVKGKDIYGYIAKPTNARKEIPSTSTAVPASGAVTAPQTLGDLSPWGFEGTSRLTENYSMWDAPTSFVNEGGSMYTFLDGSAPAISAGGSGLPSSAGPTTKNTLDDKSKTGSNDDVKKRMEEMQKRRESEFSGVARK
jgi:hypothetical protein